MESNPALAAAIAASKEWVWSALRKMGNSFSSRKLFTRAASSRTPKNVRSPSDAPTITGTFNSWAEENTAFNKTQSEMLK
jgi:hypothetical protein